MIFFLTFFKNKKVNKVKFLFVHFFSFFFFFFFFLCYFLSFSSSFSFFL